MAPFFLRRDGIEKRPNLSTAARGDPIDWDITARFVVKNVGKLE